ncbi:MAG: HAD hydrolase-like protein [Candidatus Fermentibacteraceae bacterium]
MHNGGILVAFDLDGTLHWTEKALVPAIRRAMSEMGTEPAAAEKINALYGEPLEEFCRVLLGAGRESDCSRFMLAIDRHQRDTLPATGALYPGVRGMLRELRKAGASLAVISNAGEDYIRLVLRTFGILDRFDALLGVDAGLSKARRLRSLLHTRGYGGAVMVGDRYHDLQAAAENDVRFIGCAYGYGAPGEMDRADELVGTAAEIPSAMVRLGLI